MNIIDELEDLYNHIDRCNKMVIKQNIRIIIQKYVNYLHDNQEEEI